MSDDEADSRIIYKVVINHEEQYSIWPANTSIPLGWNEIGLEGDRETCLERIRVLWTDMRPLSLRRAMQEA